MTINISLISPPNMEKPPIPFTGRTLSMVLICSSIPIRALPISVILMAPKDLFWKSGISHQRQLKILSRLGHRAIRILFNRLNKSLNLNPYGHYKMKKIDVGGIGKNSGSILVGKPYVNITTAYGVQEFL